MGSQFRLFRWQFQEGLSQLRAQLESASPRRLFEGGVNIQFPFGLPGARVETGWHDFEQRQAAKTAVAGKERWTRPTARAKEHAVARLP